MVWPKSVGWACPAAGLGPETEDADRGIDAEALGFLPGSLKFALQAGVDESNREEQVVTAIGNAGAGDFRHKEVVANADRIEDIAD